MTIHKKDSMNLAHSRLNETHTDIVLDASVLINILATGRAATILANLDRKILITSQAYNEVLRDLFFQQAKHLRRSSQWKRQT